MKAKSVVFGYEQNKDLHATTRTERQILQIAGLLIIGQNKMINLLFVYDGETTKLLMRFIWKIVLFNAAL